MTIEFFARAMVTLRRKYGGSETSGGRTDAHAVAVGGFAGDPHTWDLGSDLIYDGAAPPLDELRRTAATFGLRVLRETGKPHDHFQPLDFPAGPVAAYGGETRVLA